MRSQEVALPVTIDMRSCYFTLASTAALGVACTKEGDKIEYKASSGGKVVCTMKVGPESGLAASP